MLSRRKFLIGGAAALITVPLGAALHFTWGGYDNEHAMRYLTPKEAAVLLALFHCLVPDSEEFPVKISDEEFLTGVDVFLDVSSPRERYELSLLLVGAEYGLPLSKLKLKKFTRLPKSEQQDLVESLESAGTLLGHLFGRGIKAMIFPSYFNHPKIQEVLGHKDWCSA